MAIQYGTTGPDTINGSAENDTLYGWAEGGNANSPSGDDTLNGGGGDDTLYGGTDNDTLRGGSLVGEGRQGTDTLVGGTGNDTYAIVDADTDIIIEDSNAGVDTVFHYLYSRNTLNYTLPDNVENLKIQLVRFPDNASIVINGNAADNNIEVDYGGGGTIFGADGNDTLLSGGSMDGGAGDDLLDCTITNSNVTGGAGLDVFSFRFVSGSIPKITDFSVVDTIDVFASGFGGGLTNGAVIKPDQLVFGATAADANDRFIYNQDTGALFFDVDGIGGKDQQQFATLSPNLQLTNNNIYVV